MSAIYYVIFQPLDVSTLTRSLPLLTLHPPHSTRPATETTSLSNGSIASDPLFLAQESDKRLTGGNIQIFVGMIHDSQHATVHCSMPDSILDLCCEINAEKMGKSSQSCDTGAVLWYYHPHI